MVSHTVYSIKNTLCSITSVYTIVIIPPFFLERVFYFLERKNDGVHPFYEKINIQGISHFHQNFKLPHKCIFIFNMDYTPQNETIKNETMLKKL